MVETNQQSISSNFRDITAESLTAIIGDHNVIHRSPSYVDEDPCVFNVEDCILTFTGREEIFRQLHLQIEENMLNSEPTVVSQTATISGMGGVGKTETVRKYIQLYRHLYTNVIWINAESYAEALSCFKHLALRLKIKMNFTDGTKMEDRFLAEEIYLKLCKRKTLIVFDNVQHHKSEDKNYNVRVFFPKRARINKVPCAVIVTTRERSWNGHAGIDLLGLNYDESYDLLVSSLGIERNEANYRAAIAITQLCEGLPIVIQQVVCIIKKENKLRSVLAQAEYSLTEYVTVVNQSLETLTKTRPADSPVGDSVFTIFQITFQEMEKSKEGRLGLHCLDIMAVLSPADYIPVTMLKQLVGNISEEEFANSISLLIDHNLIAKDEEQLRVHRMIKAVRKLANNFLNTMGRSIAIRKSIS